MQIGNYNFVQTCSCSPEQYDVFDKDHNQVCYVRLRWGSLYAQCPDVGGTDIYEASIGDGWTGCFESDDQRMSHLRKIAKRIDMFSLGSEIECPYCGEHNDLNGYDFGEIEQKGRSLIECWNCEKDFLVECTVGSELVVRKAG